MMVGQADIQRSLTARASLVESAMEDIGEAEEEQIATLASEPLVLAIPKRVHFPLNVR